MEDTKKKKKELSEQQKTLIAALFGPAEGNWREAMRIAGYSENYMPSDVIAGIKDEIIDNCNSYLASLAPKAMAKMNKLLDDPNQPGAPNLTRVVESVLNRVGISEKKAGDEVNMKVPSGGLFILPAKEVQTFQRIESDEDA